MSGDFGPRFAILAAQKSVAAYPNLHVTLVGDVAQLSVFPPHPRIEIFPAETVVAMDESPVAALRHKRNSSMAGALNLLAGRQVSACVSAGNTGALVALGRHIVGTFANISLPAICKSLPSVGSPCLMLDLGASTSLTAEQLLKLALMGSALHSSRYGVSEDGPRVALLNIGSEQGKGLPHIGVAAELFTACDDINYSGFVEADGLFFSKADVVVCEGFSGNIALKACEGTARYISVTAKNTMRESLLDRLMAVLAYPLLRRWRERFDPSCYNGATLLGLRGIVVKSHGGANVEAFCSAIRVAVEQVECDAIAFVERQLSAELGAE